MRTKLPKLITLGLPVATLSAVSGLHFRAMAQEKAAVANPADDLESIVLQKNQVAWTPLNKARGDASPQAANLWGDRGTDRLRDFS